MTVATGWQILELLELLVLLALLVCHLSFRSLLPDGHDQIRAAPVDLIAEAEGQWLGAVRTIILVQIVLVKILEKLDRADIGAEEAHGPAVGTESADRNPGVVLHDRGTYVQ